MFAQNIDFEYTLETPQLGGSNVYPLTSTHNLCFRAKTRNKMHTLLLYESGVLREHKSNGRVILMIVRTRTWKFFWR